MLTIINRSRPIALVRSILGMALLTVSFTEQVTSAEKVAVNKPPKEKVSISTLGNLPAISILYGTEKLCVGILVSSNKVLTSKGCLKQIKRKKKKALLKAQFGNQSSKLSKLFSTGKLKVGVIKLKQKLTKASPTKLYSISRIGFGKDFLVAGFAKKLDDEIGYLTATYADENSGATHSIACFGNSGMPALVRRPTAVVGMATYGFGNCFFDSEVTFQNVGSKAVLSLIKSSH
jgi:hypothetical protein